MLRKWPWLISPRFDLSLVMGVLVLAIATAAVVVRFPDLFLPVLLLDLWLLGYHHVIATYTRLCFDKTSFQNSRFLIFGLFPLVAIATLSLAHVAGLWTIFTIYFYWQWFHYARQSWGISRAYRAKDPDALYEDGWLDKAIFYAVPVLGILYRSHQNPERFINFEIKTLPVSTWIVTVAAAVTAILLACWIVRRVQAWLAGQLSPVHTLYMLSHFTIFAVGYLWIKDVTYGWLAINIWHNAQYILFVWMFNARRFRGGVDSAARFLSYISQPRRLWLYLAVCIAITGIFYVGVLGTINNLFLGGVAGTLVLYQIVNFHHYVVDSLIWKVRKAPIRQTLGLQG